MGKKILFILLLLISSVGFSQKKSLINLTASPNPFTNSTKISFQSELNNTTIFSVYNLLGKKVFSKNINPKEGINTFVFYKNNLSSGIYMYSIENPNTTITKRLVIK